MAKPQYFPLKGDGFVRLRGSGKPFRYVGNMPNAVFGMTREKATLVSSGNESGDLASKTISKSATLSVTLSSIEGKNMAMALQSVIHSQLAATALPFMLPALAVGEAFSLGHVGILTVTHPSLVAGVDYKLLKSSGIIRALKAIPADIEGGTFSCGAGSEMGVFTNETDAEYEFIFAAEEAGKVFTFNRWQPDPATALNLISTEYTSIELTGAVLIDEDLPEGPLGRFGTVKDSIVDVD